jgi:hypothetical protein
VGLSALRLTIKEVGGGKTLAMVQRYAHLPPNRLREAVERLVELPGTSPPSVGALLVYRNYLTRL